jgi:flagellar protein FlgJ
MITDSSSDLADVYNDFSGLNKLHAEAAKQTDAAKRETAKQFESLFLQMMIKTMREAGGKGLLDSDQTEMARDMYDQQLAINLSKNGSIGIADMVMRQLGVEPEPTLPESSKVQPITRHLGFVENIWGHGESSPTTTTTKTPRWKTPEDFINDLYPAAEKAANKLGTQPEAVLAIAALETGWGKHVMNNSNGNSSYNLFGIKANHGWDKGATIASTLEFENGVMQRKNESFRAYHNATDSVNDFANFILNNPRYQNALQQAEDPQTFISEIHAAGYATDPKYVEKIQPIMQKIRLMTKNPN